MNRLPLRSKILNLASNYWQHLLSSPNRLVSKTLKATKSHNNLFTKMGSIFNNLGFSYLSETANFNIYNSLCIKQRITDIQQQEQDTRLRISRNVFMKCYGKGNRPKYIDLLKFRNGRAMITKLRISAHKRKIEVGRCINILKCERFCNVCHSCKIEDEEHFLLKCSLHNSLRQGFRSKIKNINNQSLNLQTIIDNDSHCILKLSSDLTGNCLKLRESTIS